MRLPLQTQIEVGATLAARGMVRPVRPDRVVRQLLALRKYGVSLAAAYAGNAALNPGRDAIVDDRGSLGYGDLEQRTSALARAVRSLGVSDEDRIAVLARNGRGFVEPVIAAAKLGCDVLLLNTSFSATELKAVLERERPAVLFHDGEFGAIVGESAGPAIMRIVGHPDGKRAGHAHDADALADAFRSGGLPAPAREARTVILTSGTTGTPKGARIPRPEGIEPLAWLLRRVPLRAGWRYLIPAPLFHAHGFGQLVIGSALGCTLVLPRRFDAAETLALIERHRVEAVAMVPVMLKRIMDLPQGDRARYDTGSLRVVLSSGSALPGDFAHAFMRQFGPVLYNLYGSTEVAGATIATPQDLEQAPGTAGRALPHTRLAILDDDGKPLPRGRTGRIFVGHEMLFEGYTDGGSLAEVAGMMSPGDLGHVDEQGRLFVESRADDMIVSGGENVYPSEVEAALLEHPEVDEVAVVGVEDTEFGQRLAAFVVPKAGATLDADAMRAFAKGRLARFKVPRDVEIRDELPRNALGKVLKRELR